MSFRAQSVPRGMLAWSPDTTHADKIAGGYWYPDQAIEGFSLTHFSGRGVPCLKDIPFMPTLKPVTGSPGSDWAQFAATFSHTNERASAGYYRVRLDDGIETELTATPRTGLARFSFPPDSAATLLVRADGSVAINGNEVSGFHSNVISGKKRSFKLYFAAVFDRPFQNSQHVAGTDPRKRDNCQRHKLRSGSAIRCVNESGGAGARGHFLCERGERAGQSRRRESDLGLCWSKRQGQRRRGIRV